MPSPQKHPLRALTEQEERALSRIAKASSERVDTVRRAKALLTVSAGEPCAEAAWANGFTSADSAHELRNEIEKVLKKSLPKGINKGCARVA